MIGTADAHGAERHAVWADPATAFGARDQRLPIRVAVAAKGLGHRG